MTTLPVAGLAAGLADMAVVAHFADGGGWTTQLVLINGSDEPMRGKVQFYNQGAPDDAASPIRMAINAEAVATDLPMKQPQYPENRSFHIWWTAAATRRRSCFRIPDRVPSREFSDSLINQARLHQSSEVDEHSWEPEFPPRPGNGQSPARVMDRCGL